MLIISLSILSSVYLSLISKFSLQLNWLATAEEIDDMFLGDAEVRYTYPLFLSFSSCVNKKLVDLIGCFINTMFLGDADFFFCMFLDQLYLFLFYHSFSLV